MQKEALFIARTVEKHVGFLLRTREYNGSSINMTANGMIDPLGHEEVSDESSISSFESEKFISSLTQKLCQRLFFGDCTKPLPALGLTVSHESPLERQLQWLRISEKRRYEGEEVTEWGERGQVKVQF